MKTKFPAVETLAISVAAFEYTDGRIVRIKLSEGPESNKQLISDYLAGRGAPFLVSDSHRAQAEELIQYLQQTVIMQSLRGTPDRFLAQVNEIVSNQEVTDRDLGIIAWAPKLASDYRKKDRVREVSARYEAHSRYVGHVRDRITTDFTLIDKRYVKSMDCWAVYGYDAQDNLLFYWAKNSDKICEVGKISARIKDHRKDEYRGNAQVTVLNYVKVL